MLLWVGTSHQRVSAGLSERARAAGALEGGEGQSQERAGNGKETKYKSL